MEVFLIRLVDMCFNGMFTDPLCMYIRPSGRSVFNQIGGHGFQ